VTQHIIHDIDRDGWGSAALLTHKLESSTRTRWLWLGHDWQCGEEVLFQAEQQRLLSESNSHRPQRQVALLHSSPRSNVAPSPMTS